jgi:hypothetical protein
MINLGDIVRWKAGHKPDAVTWNEGYVEAINYAEGVATLSVVENDDDDFPAIHDVWVGALEIEQNPQHIWE